MNLRHEAMLMLDKRGAVLETARTISRLLTQNHIPGAIIGGVAVVLHGHLRTTRDVDVFIQPPLENLRSILEREGFTFDAPRREFLHGNVPVHLVPAQMLNPQPTEFIELEQIQTLTLPDLISIKLHSGMKHLTRAQDLADVIGLIRHHRLTAAFASQIDPPVRAEFRKLVHAIEHEKGK